MTTTPETINYILEQTAQAGVMSAKKMFGGYCLYCDNKVVALVCDDQLFVKPTKAGRVFIGECEEQPPYKGAKPYFYVSGDRWDDKEWLSFLIKISATELPLPKP
ncbi:MAG: TfoX/Sxy family protein [Taibaiella sp.]|jgi:TfoX/Sxy family transcriptional regulator of competence genes